MNFDHRDVAANTNKWYECINTKNMTVTVKVAWCEEGLEELKEDLSEEAYNLIDEQGCVVLPMRFEVCPTCDGRGKYVNPSIDAHGITSDEWNEEWSYEEREVYMSGGYDILCCECDGEKVVPEINTNAGGFNNAKKEIKDLVDSNIGEEARYVRLCMAEREMGA
jgi:hypothetical protein